MATSRPKVLKVKVAVKKRENRKEGFRVECLGFSNNRILGWSFIRKN